MWPWLVICGIGERRRFPLPLPLVLAWPFVLLGWLGYALGWPFTRRGEARAAWARYRFGLSIFPGLRGLRIDVRPRVGPGVWIQVI